MLCTDGPNDKLCELQLKILFSFFCGNFIEYKLQCILLRSLLRRMKYSIFLSVEQMVF